MFTSFASIASSLIVQSSQLVSESQGTLDQKLLELSFAVGRISSIFTTLAVVHFQSSLDRDATTDQKLSQERNPNCVVMTSIPSMNRNLSFYQM